MKNIIHIFRKDVRGLCRNFFALVIAIGLCFIPSLYAWFNIYSNEDPYANTGNIYIAVASEDEGMKLEDGTTVNMGVQVIEQLKENKSIGWQFVDSSDEAINGVESGKYYAAVVIGDRFSESMFSIFSKGLENPTITYYENEKKNAIATKITDTAVSTLKSSINETFLETAASAMFAQMDNLSEKISEDGGVDGFRQKLEQLSQNLKDYDAMIDSFLSGNEELSAGIDEANSSVSKVEDKIDSAVNSLNGTKTQLDSTDTTLSDFSKNVETTLTDIENSLNKISTDITNAGLGDSAKKTTESIETTTNDIKTLNDQLQSLYGAISGLKTDESFTDEQKTDMDDVMSQIDALKQDAEEMQKLLETLMPDNASDVVKDAVDTVTAKISLVMKCQETGTPIISCMGAGNKMDASAFKVADIYKTKVCPLAKVMRRELKKRGVKKLKVVYSEEKPMTPIEDENDNCKNNCICPPGVQRTCLQRRAVPGSMAFVPAVAGLIIAGEVVKDIIAE